MTLAKLLLSLDFDLKSLEDKMDELRGYWDGKDSGFLEDLAHCAQDIQEKSKELRTLLDELEESF